MTPLEFDIVEVRRHRRSLISRLDEIDQLIRQGKKLEYGKHFVEVEGMTTHLLGRLRDLVPDPPERLEVNRLQGLVDDVITDYMSEKELDPELLKGGREPFDVKLRTYESMWHQGDGNFEIPEALLNNHRDEILDHIRGALEEPFDELVEMTCGDGEITDSTIKIT